MNKINLFLIVTFLGVAISVNSQVKIGDTTAPNSFSALEVANIGKGVRLNQLTISERDDLTNIITASPNVQLAEGLIIYNTNNKQIEMWRDDTDKWIVLPSKGTCTPIQSVQIISKGSTTLDEYGSEDLTLEAKVTGNSNNADLYFEWYINDKQIAQGKNYIVPKERLSFKDAGKYMVKVISCASTNSIDVSTSTPLIITVNEQN